MQYSYIIIICYCYTAELEKWEVPPINEVNRKLEKIERAIKRQDEAIDDLRLVYYTHNIFVHLSKVVFNRTTLLEKLNEQSKMIRELYSHHQK